MFEACLGQYKCSSPVGKTVSKQEMKILDYLLVILLRNFSQCLVSCLFFGGGIE